MWSLEKLHQIGELVAALAVVISIVFVGLQIRDNTIASEAATHQASVAYDLEILLRAGQSPATARVYRTFRDDPASLKEDEYIQGELLYIGLYRHNENIYLQHLSGMLSTEVWSAREPFLRRFIRTPGFSKLISGSNKENYGGPFMEYAERILEEEHK